MSQVKHRTERSRRLGKQARADPDGAGHTTSRSEQFQRDLAESAELGASAERNRQLAREAAEQTTHALRAASRLLRRAARQGRRR